MKKNLYLNPDTYDIELQNYNIRVTNTTTEYLSQKIEYVLKTLKGEFFAEENLGVPYYQDILGKQLDVNKIISLFKEIILEIDEVSEIIEFTAELTNSNRNFEINFSVKNNDGEIIEGIVEV